MFLRQLSIWQHICNPAGPTPLGPGRPHIHLE